MVGIMRLQGGEDPLNDDALVAEPFAIVKESCPHDIADERLREDISAETLTLAMDSEAILVKDCNSNMFDQALLEKLDC